MGTGNLFGDDSGISENPELFGFLLVERVVGTLPVKAIGASR